MRQEVRATSIGVVIMVKEPVMGASSIMYDTGRCRSAAQSMPSLKWNSPYQAFSRKCPCNLWFAFVVKV
jgi:hypothetical protein